MNPLLAGSAVGRGASPGGQRGSSLGGGGGGAGGVGVQAGGGAARKRKETVKRGSWIVSDSGISDSIRKSSTL
jgi:hypothetical protein